MKKNFWIADEEQALKSFISHDDIKMWTFKRSRQWIIHPSVPFWKHQIPTSLMDYVKCEKYNYEHLTVFRAPDTWINEFCAELRPAQPEKREFRRRVISFPRINLRKFIRFTLDIHAWIHYGRRGSARKVSMKSDFREFYDRIKNLEAFKIGFWG